MTLLVMAWGVMADMPIVVVLAAMACDTILLSIAMLTGVVHL
jgi:hypothetical protein